MSDHATCSVWSDLSHSVSITEERRVETHDDDIINVRYVPTGERVTLKPGLAEGVDAAWFAKWLAANAEYEPVRKGLIRILAPQARTG